MASRHSIVGSCSTLGTWTLWVGLAAAALAVTAGCGGDDDDDSGTSNGDTGGAGNATSSSGGSSDGSGGGSTESGGESAAGTGGTVADPTCDTSRLVCVGGSLATDGTGGASTGGDASAAGGSTEVPATGGAENEGEPQGRFELTLTAEIEESPVQTYQPENAKFIGRVRDANLLPEPRTVAAVEGGCQLLKPTSVFCSPECDVSAEVCSMAGVCVPKPALHSVGTVTVSGVGTEDMVLEPMSATNPIYQPGSVPFPPCSEGDTVTVSAAGADYPAFTVATPCVQPLEVVEDVIDMAPNQDATFTTNAPAQTGQSRILINVDISHHGGFKGEIVCDLPDTGTVTIPANLVTQLIELGWAGYPSLTVTRVSSAVASVDTGQVELAIESVVYKAISLPGLVSCTEDSHCVQ